MKTTKSYRCIACDWRGELTLEDHAELNLCPECEHILVRDWKADAPAVQFKGDGFATNDLKKKEK